MTGTALITGAGRRIGRAMALDLAKRGWAVAVHYNRSADAAKSVVDDIMATGGKAVALAADLADESAVRALIPRCGEALGPPTLLINNASLFENDSFATVSRDSWSAHMAINLRAPLVLIQGFMAALPEDDCGNVINMLDQRVWNLTPYCPS